ncbi:schlafen family member 13-like [Nycticebus coucang]|uniref:schlafen family member 13-like n=1 Tax=Nycticebus coucang TaxID=9470 RepID=UPI00234DA057|nr:schlafen family member 13-like [Nycticebus coucang]
MFYTFICIFTIFGAFHFFCRFEFQSGIFLLQPKCSPASQIVGKERVSMMTNTNEVPSDHLRCIIKSVSQKLVSEHEGPKELIDTQMYPFSQGILIFSSSRPVDLNLQEKNNKNICKAVTLKTFMENGFEYIQRIIINGAQNFSTEVGEWYKKAKTITQRAQPRPGVFWIFLDYFKGISILFFFFFLTTYCWG